MNNILHIYEHEAPHDDVYIDGTREAFEMMRDTLDMLLSNERPARFDTFVNDGEGYSVRFRLRAPDKMMDLAVPYTEDWAKDDEVTTEDPAGEPTVFRNGKDG